MNRKIFQIILAIIGLIAVITGVMGMAGGIGDEFYGVDANRGIEGNIILDSNLRYFSGLWLGLGLILFWMIPSVEQKGLIFRLIAVMIFIGAIGRIYSMVSFGVPSIPFIIFTLLELLFPLLIIWQQRISRSYGF